MGREQVLPPWHPFPPASSGPSLGLPLPQGTGDVGRGCGPPRHGQPLRPFLLPAHIAVPATHQDHRSRHVAGKQDPSYTF